MRERAVCFGESQSLIGILAEPASTQSPPDLPGILFLNAGWLHRVGPNRIYVGMARSMADLGFATLRFDLSGIGDSRNRHDHLQSKQSATSDVRDAMAYLSSAQGVERFILIGHCSGADLALDVAVTDAAVVGAVLINGFYFSEMPEESTPAMYAHFLARNIGRHLLNVQSWRRVLTRRHDLRRLLLALRYRLSRGKGRDVPAHGEVERRSVWQTLTERDTELLLVYSEGSAAYDRFRLAFEEHCRALEASRKLQVEVILQTDHLFTPISQQQYLMKLVSRWIGDDTRGWRL